MSKLLNSNTHLQWYLRFDLTDDISIRYYFIFEDRPEYNKKWFLKSHFKKEYGEISEEAVKLLFEVHNLTLNDGKEVIARSISNQKYRKIELIGNKFYNSPDKIVFEVEKDNDKVMSLLQYIKT